MSRSIDTEQLGLAIIELGGGRKVMTDKIDHAVGLEMLVRIGDRVEAGQPVVGVFAPREKSSMSAAMIAARDHAVSISRWPACR